MISWEDGDHTQHPRHRRRSEHGHVYAGIILATVFLLTGCTVSQWATGSWSTSFDGSAVTLDEEAARETSVETRVAVIADVIDGHTVSVRASEHFPADQVCDEGSCTEHTISLLGIQSPELSSQADRPEAADCGGHDAAGHLRNWVLSQGADVEVVVTQLADADPTEPTSAYVQVDTPAGLQDLGLMQATYGYATVPRPENATWHPNQHAYSQAQSLAQQQGLGLHSTCPGFGRP